MSAGLLDLVSRFTGLRVGVVGEAMLDTYLAGSASSLCREAPVPTVTLSARTNLPGGAANTAVNVAALGASVTFCSVVGSDLEAGLLRDALQGLGVTTEHLWQHPLRRTLTKNRIVSDSQILIRFDEGTTAPLDACCEERLCRKLEELFDTCDAIILSDYDKGLLTPHVLDAIARLQARRPRLLVADARDLSGYRLVRPSAVKPSYAEAARLLGLRPLEAGGDRLAQVAGSGDRLLGLIGCELAAVTLDRDGAMLFERGHAPYRTYAKPVLNAHALGAGDAYTAALALALAAGAPTHAAGELASAAAAVAIGKECTCVCSATELEEHVLTGDKYVEDLGRLASRVELHRRQGRRVVFTNGCFDLLHRGHITYLVRAKTLGDVLVVGVNSDASIARLKGPARPVTDLKDRLGVLAGLSCIDHLTSFEEDTPEALIRALRPEVFVKGGDYTKMTIPEAALVESLGGTVQVLPYVDGCSTTATIRRIQQAADRGYRGQPAGLP